MKNKFELLIVGIVFIMLIPAALGLLHPGFFVSDDGTWMIVRLSAFYSALTSGQFPVRFLPQLNQGFGYPVADFLYPLFLYIGSGMHILRFPFVMIVKMLFILGIISSGIGIYFWLRSFFRQLPSLLGGLIFVYFPYHLYDIYVRGSLGEVVALGIVPWVLYSLERRKILLSGLLIGLLILSHNTLALFFLPVLFFYALVRRIFSLKTLLFPFVLGLGLSCFFWLPALFDKQFTVFDSIPVANPSAYFLTFSNISLLGWVSAFLLGGVLFVRKFWNNQLVIFFFVISLLSLFFSFPISSVFWSGTFLTKFVQFPFRFLSLILLSFAFLGAYIFENLKSKMVPFLLFIIILGISSYPFLLPKRYVSFPESYYATNADTTTVQNEYMPKWVKIHPIVQASKKVWFATGEGNIRISKEKGTNLLFEYTSSKNGSMKVDFVYFPGWTVLLDNRQMNIRFDNPQGLIQFDAPAGMHRVHVFFAETPLRTLADIISSVSCLCIVIVVGKNKLYGTKS